MRNMIRTVLKKFHRGNPVEPEERAMPVSKSGFPTELGGKPISAIGYRDGKVCVIWDGEEYLIPVDVFFGERGTALKPCPVCGSKPVTHQCVEGYQTLCSPSDHGIFSGGCNTVEESHESWNNLVGKLSMKKSDLCGEIEKLRKQNKACRQQIEQMRKVVDTLLGYEKS